MATVAAAAGCSGWHRHQGLQALLWECVQTEPRRCMTAKISGVGDIFVEEDPISAVMFYSMLVQCCGALDSQTGCSGRTCAG
jgi:hypothetical protein